MKNSVSFLGCFLLVSCSNPVDMLETPTPQMVIRDDFDFAVREVEQNYVGYFFLDNEAINEYNLVKEKLRDSISSKTLTPFDAVGRYLAWFQCPHLRTCWDDHDYLKKPHVDYSSIIYNPQKLSCRITEKTYLIRFPSCFGEDPSAQWIKQSIKDYKKSKCDFLILDIRGNRGGNDEYYKPYLKLLYDAPSTTDGADFFYTKKNFLQMREYFPVRMFIQSLFHNKNKERVIWPFVRNNRIVYLNRTKKPIAAALIIDNYVASAGEQMVIEIKAASKRTTVYGKENTYGCLDISNCRPVDLPYSGRSILVPMTVSHRLPDRGIDKDGICPDVRINLPYPIELSDNIDEWSLWLADKLEREH